MGSYTVTCLPWKAICQATWEPIVPLPAVVIFVNRMLISLDVDQRSLPVRQQQCPALRSGPALRLLGDGGSERETAAHGGCYVISPEPGGFRNEHLLHRNLGRRVTTFAGASQRPRLGR